MKNSDSKRLANLFYEIGTMRKITRMHRQALLTDDLSDNIATHSFRVAIIAWVIAKEEGADSYKTLLMALLHDVAETRANDHNWIHKRYVKVYEDEITEDQFGSIPFPEMKACIIEYEERKSKESLIVKDADLLEQELLLREYELQGNKEAVTWLKGKDGIDKKHSNMLHFETSKNLSRAIHTQSPSSWWSGLWTNKSRS